MKFVKISAVALSLCVFSVFSSQGQVATPKVTCQPAAPVKPEMKPKMKGWFEKADTNGDNKLSKTELEAFKHEFIIKADLNNDGFVTREEMREWNKKRSELQGKTFLEKKDTNKDGKVTIEEFGPDKEKFARLDTNKDGVLTEADFTQPKGARAFANQLKSPTDFIGINDKDKDGKLSRTEFKGNMKRFEMMDKNKDGFITSDEISAMRMSRDERFTRFDKNNDGKITKTEFTGKKDTFKTLDANSDGSIDKNEFFSNLSKLTREQRFILTYDTNGDNKLSSEECKMNPKIFTDIDTNKDKFITTSELADFDKKMQEKKMKKAVDLLKQTPKPSEEPKKETK